MGANAYILLRLRRRGIPLYTRCKFDSKKNANVKRKHAVRLGDACEIFEQAYLVDGRTDDPEQFRAIGWVGARLCSVIFELRHDSEGEYYHLITACKATADEERASAENT